MDLKKIKKLLGNNLELVFSELGIDYQKNGQNITCSCPVHEDSDNPNSFSYNSDRHIWSCWTRGCQQEFGNDIFGLIRGVLSVEAESDVGFSGALKWACKILNIDNKSVHVEKQEEDDQFVSMVKMFSKEDSPSYDDQEVQIDCNVMHPSDYFKSRGFTDSTLLHFQVGDCVQKKSSMVSRAIIPVHSLDGEKVVAYIGRSMQSFLKPKFLFTRGFNKNKYLYNYHRAIQKAQEKSCLFITEGQGDVWKLYEAGVENAISIFGKSVSPVQKSILEKSGITKLVVLTDNDQAGREAKMKIQRDMSRMFKVVFPRLSRKDVGDMCVEDIKTSVLPQLKGMY